jgi:thiamine-phosphate pyrophosphorylase
MSLYLITDIRSDSELISMLTPLLKNGLRWIQIRNKHATSKEIEKTARILLPHILKNNATLIINDHLDIALRLHVGVHLGRTDGDPVHARKVLGPNAIIGITIHDDLQYAHLHKDIASYVGVGPVFLTKTKLDTQSVLGTERLKQVVQSSPLPVVAIGGINNSNIDSVAQACPTHIAVCSAICSAKNPLHSFLNIQRKIENSQSR